MKSLLLATTNDRKVKEAQAACEQLGIEIHSVQFEIIEIQSMDSQEIGIDKVNKAFAIAQKPVVVTDTSWNIPALKGFPGGYMKDIASWFEAEDFLNLIKDKNDRRVSFMESIFYKDLQQTKVFSREFWGIFADQPKGIGNSIERVAQFNGLTIGENRAMGKLSHDPKDYIWVEFAKWFSEQDS